MANKNEARRLQQLLKAAGFVLVRREAHEVWRHPKLGLFVVSATPGDVRAMKNATSLLRRIQAGKETRIHKRD